MAQTRILANGTADAGGNVVITFPPINVNAEFTGVISVPSSPPATIWNLIVNDVIETTNGGSSQYGPLQLNSTDVLRLTASGLTPGVQYQGIAKGALVSGTAGSVLPIPTASAALAALTAGLAGAGIAGVAVLTHFATNLSSTAKNVFTPGAPGQIWTWGWVPTVGATAPTMGGFSLSSTAPGGGEFFDTLTYLEGASNRPGGLNFAATANINLQNNSDQTEAMFVTYSFNP